MRGFVAVTLGALTFGCYDAEDLEVARQVDLAQLEGRWYEIAKLPRHSQTDCYRTTARYEKRSSREFLLVNECRVGGPEGPVERAEAKLFVPDPGVPAKLALDFGFYQGEHWILEVDPAYQYVVVGHPTRQYLWFLSRTRTLPEATLDQLLDEARRQNFVVERMEYTRH